jgi:hypothetical protein
MFARLLQFTQGNSMEQSRGLVNRTSMSLSRSGPQHFRMRESRVSERRATRIHCRKRQRVAVTMSTKKR